MPETTLTVTVHEEDDGSLWAEVKDLPGCFASGDTMEELQEALAEAVSLYLSKPGHRANVQLSFWKKVGETTEGDADPEKIDILVS